MKNNLYIIDTSLLDDENVFRSNYENMTEHRKNKIDAFRFLKDKKLSLGAGILMHKALHRKGIQNVDLSFNQNKKPFIAGLDNVFFNLSHSGNLAVCAVSDRCVGVDIEQLQHFDEEVIKQIYLPEEIKNSTLFSESTDFYYTRIWTIKESVMKYFGTGLMLEPKKITVSLNHPVKVQCNEFDTSALNFKQYNLDGYSLTVCSEYPDFTEEPEWI